ncbi:E3 ubiquitin-protein ligase XBAT32 [Acorus calamus]|uniref:E3 ubiquitin-protein ligase XBAT32 n=1 Tax=Acorus calamus TaxID=4465 RepID=A0AAV9FB59_ACOCL|nr:E3 ubiquitin-protein ligase XBAT32 [Acorus calamus]
MIRKLHRERERGFLASGLFVLIRVMGFLSIMGNSFGCSASGERLVSAARDGDLQEAKALLEYNPRLARYSTFGIRNSPLHYSAAQGHHEIVSLLLESGVDINFGTIVVRLL